MRLDDELSGYDDVGEDESLVGELDEDTVEQYLGSGSVGGVDIIGDELVGDVDIIGDESLIGAGPRRRAVRRHRVARRPGRSARDLINQQMLQKRFSHARIIRRTPPTTARRQAIGFSVPNVPAGAIAEIVQRPQYMFQGKRLSVSPSLAPFFEIQLFRVGVTPQFASSGAQPAEAYAGNSYGAALSLDVCEPGMEMALNVRNTTTADHPFSATCFGDAYR